MLVKINQDMRRNGIPSTIEEIDDSIEDLGDKVQFFLDGIRDGHFSNIDNLLRANAEIMHDPAIRAVYRGIADRIEWDDLGQPEITYQDEFGHMLSIAKKSGERDDTAAYDCYKIMADKLKEDPVGALTIREDIGLRLMANNDDLIEQHYRKTGEKTERDLTDNQVNNLQLAVDMFDRTYEYNEVMAKLVDLMITPAREVAKSATSDKLMFDEHIRLAAKELEPLFDMVRDDSGWDTAVMIAKNELADRAHRAIAKAEAENDDVLPIDPKDLLDYAAYRVFMLATAPEEVRNAA